MTDSSKQIIELIKQQAPLIKQNYSCIHVLYLFGSFAKGVAKPDSDIDIAIFIDNS